MKSQEKRARQLLHAEEADLVYGKWQFHFKLSGSGNFASLNRTAKPATFGRQGERSTLLKGYGRDAADLLQRTTAAVSAAGGREEKVVYHINDASNAMAAMGNIRNHLNASPKAQIVVVAHGPGIDFLLEDAKDKNGNPYDAVVQELSNRNVKFRVCNNTLEARKIDRKRVLPEATVVPSGVAEVARLQYQEGYAYLKP